MLKLFRLLARGAAAQAEEAVIDRHALLILDQQIRETRVSLERSRQALAAAMAGDKAEERRFVEVEARAADLEERALAALTAGREELASEAAEASKEPSSKLALTGGLLRGCFAAPQDEVEVRNNLQNNQIRGDRHSKISPMT